MTKRKGAQYFCQYQNANSHCNEIQFTFTPE